MLADASVNYASELIGIHIFIPINYIPGSEKKEPQVCNSGEASPEGGLEETNHRIQVQSSLTNISNYNPTR